MVERAAPLLHVLDAVPPGAGGRPPWPPGSVAHGGHPQAPPHTVDLAWSNGQPRCSMCWMYSSRKYLMDDITGLVAPSPRAQNERPSRLSQMSRSFSTSASVPSPFSSRSSTWTIQKLPSRQGVHLPQDSWA